MHIKVHFYSFFLLYCVSELIKLSSRVKIRCYLGGFLAAFNLVDTGLS